MITYKSRSGKMDGFIRMDLLIDFLESDASVEDKIREIDEQVADKFLTEYEAIGMKLEFCEE